MAIVFVTAVVCVNVTAVRGVALTFAAVARYVVYDPTRCKIK